jgi:hypothetical protein
MGPLGLAPLGHQRTGWPPLARKKPALKPKSDL